MKTKKLLYFQSLIILILIVLLFKCCNDNKETCSTLNFETSPNNISAEQANTMEELYKANQYLILNDSFGITDYRENWYSLKELKSYLCYIEKKAELYNYNKNSLGIRVYNAAKQKGDKIKSSIFMIGTHNIISDEENINNNPNEPQKNMMVIEPNRNMLGIDAFNMGDPGGNEFNLK